MKVLITTLGGEKSTLNVTHIKFPAHHDGSVNSYKGIYIAEDEQGNKLLDEKRKPIEFNVASRTGIGFLDDIECTYVVDGHLSN